MGGFLRAVWLLGVLALILSMVKRFSGEDLKPSFVSEKKNNERYIVFLVKRREKTLMAYGDALLHIFL